MKCLNCKREIPEGQEAGNCPKAKGYWTKIRLPNGKRKPKTGHEFSFADLFCGGDKATA